MIVPRKEPCPTPPILALPPEIHGIITSYLVQLRDLNSLVLSCKTLKAIALPKLYHTVQLKVPLKWNRLASLEKLLATSPEGLCHTRRLWILAQQAPIKDDRYGNRDDLDLTDSEGDEVDSRAEADDESFRLYAPDMEASCALNALVRLLVLKTARQQLREFLWEHECTLATSTLAILLNNHGLSLQTLHFRQSTKKWKKTNLTALALDCLTNLKIGELDILGDMWPFYLLAKNYKRLHHLHLSNETALANLYTNGGDINRGNTNEFIKKLEYEFATLDESAVPTMQLKSLSLCGLDLSMLVKDFLKPGIDFNNLDSLTLESCTELNRAFPMLIGARGIPHNTVGPLRLRTFVLRHENPNQEFMIDLEIFLLSLRPLNSLHILLQGLGPCPSLESVLKFHGKALLSLIWDHRFKARTTASISTTTRYGSFDHMRWIAKYCVRLQALGITLDWETLSRSDEYHNKVSTYFSKLRYLETLNVRNSPEAPIVKHWFPNDYVIEALVTLLVDVLKIKARRDRPRLLKTIGVGSHTYGNAVMGANHYPMHKAADFLQLRIYRVNYGHSSRGSNSPRPHLIAKGTPADAYGEAENLDIFNVYWLDAAIQKPGLWETESMRRA